MMTKIDLKKTLPDMYSADKHSVSIVDVPRVKYIMLEGKGDPSAGASMRYAAETLQILARTMRAINKRNPDTPDFTIMPLEAQWWAETVGAFVNDDRQRWYWNSMIALPNFITRDVFREAKKKLLKTKRIYPGLRKVKYKTVKDGLSVQLLHVGAFERQGDAIDVIHEYILENGYKLSGLHHEIYLNDMTRHLPQRMRTVVRQPVDKVKPYVPPVFDDEFS